MTFTVSRGDVKRGELARISGCNLETIRYYENIGLMPDPARTDSGHRLYSPDNQRRLRFVLRARELGFSIDEIRSLLSLVVLGTYTCGEIYDITQEHLKSVSDKIADLQKLQLTLENISKDCATGDEPECPIVDTLIRD